MSERDWMVVRKSRTIPGGFRVVKFGLTEEKATAWAASYKTPHQIIREPDLMRIRLDALAAREGVDLRKEQA